MKMIWVHLVLLLQATSVFCQIRQSTFQVSSVDSTNLILSVGSYYPLKNVVNYLNREYGWRISYEDPFYPDNEVVDIAVPQWKKSHPGERGFYVPKWADVRFRITKPLGKEGEQKKVITELVEQFNRLDRPDKFTVVDASLNRNVVIGEISGESLLGRASLGPEKKLRSGSEELQTFTEQCSAQMQMRMVIGTVSVNLMEHITVPPRKSKISCRDALLSLTAQGGAELVYQLLEDINGPTYVVNIAPNRVIIHPQP